MNILKRLLLPLFVFVSLVAPVAATSQALAYDVLAPACTNSVGTDSPTCNSRTDKNPLTGPQGYLMRVVMIVAVVAGFAAIITIIVSGAQYMTAGGDAQKAAGARRSLIGALIGLAIISLAGVIVMIVLKKVG